jgi:hypothetical protein
MIIDEFTSLPVSYVRKYELRHLRDGKCPKCPRPRKDDSTEYCQTHAWMKRQPERQPGPHENDAWVIDLMRDPFGAIPLFGSSLCEPDVSHGRRTKVSRSSHYEN